MYIVDDLLIALLGRNKTTHLSPCELVCSRL